MPTSFGCFNIFCLSDKTEEKEEANRKILKNKQRLKLPPALLRLADEKTSVSFLFE